MVSFIQVVRPEPRINLSFPNTCHMPRSSHSYLIATEIFGEWKSWRFSLCNFIQSPVFSSLLSPFVFLSTLFSNTLNPRLSLSVRDQVSHPYMTQNVIKIFVALYATKPRHVILWPESFEKINQSFTQPWVAPYPPTNPRQNCSDGNRTTSVSLPHQQTTH